MGKFDGKQIRGLVGNIVIRKGKKAPIVQSAPRKYKQTKATKQESSLFGKGSILASALRHELNLIISSNQDGEMVNRFNTPIKAVLRQCYDPETQKFNFSEDSFSRLAGFEFNIKSPLINSLWVSPEMQLNGNILTISLPEIEIPALLKFPLAANICTLMVIASFTSLEQCLRKPSTFQTLEISQNETTIPARQFDFEVPQGCLCIAGIGLKYFSVHNSIRTTFNSKAFNPAGIIGAVISPGTFVLPPPVRIGNK
ncbi:MAG TPA: hypothetical protein VNZ46_12075, partial [Pedobacter sp.]|nr:hypothetical protein [Pedobacter sp.]